MNWVLFLAVLALTESDGNINAVGDTNLQNRAYGVMQIRQIYLDDVNRIAGSNFTLKQVRQRRGLSRWCVVIYIKHYGRRYTRLTGLPLTMKVAANLHNGGPNGWQKSSTNLHWERFHRKRLQIE